jgi:hypothetical protein
MKDNRSTRADARKRSHLAAHPNESLHATISVKSDGDKADYSVEDFANGQSLKRRLQRAVRGVAVPGRLSLRIQQMLREP